MPIDAKAIYQKIKKGIPYQEEVHCPQIVSIMASTSQGMMADFCIEVGIGESKFYDWLNQHPLFLECYALGKMYARKNWEIEGAALRGIPYEELGCSFEHWRMVGWSRFGVGKNSRIRLNLNPKDTPDKHYTQLMQAAKDGEYTAGEIKQLMEAVNVGLKADENFRLQKEVDEIKLDLAKMELNKNGQNSITTQSIA